MSAMNPTPEQQKILDAFATRGSMVIEAGAGTGKTTTLRMIAESTTRRGLYIAYNRAIKDDATGTFPSNVHCKTAHGLAYGQFVTKNNWVKNRLNARRLPSRQQVALLGIPAGGYQVDDDHRMEPWTIARLATQAVGRFCYSADDQIAARHVPFTEGITGSAHDALANFVVPFARKVWADITDPKGSLKVEHDHYLKMWALTNPRLRYDFIMLDEAQDANPLIAQIVESQDAQKIMVGDRCQAIYGWRGAIDAMTRFDADHRLVLSQSFRFGPAVAEVANGFLDLLDAPLRITGAGPTSEVTVLDALDADAILCRTNAAVIQYALDALAQGRTVAIVGGTAEIKSFAQAAEKLMIGKTTTHAELCAFKSWDEVLEYVQTDDGADLRVMVKMITEHGVQAILDMCGDANVVKEDEADVIISTAHKAKGRQWGAVKIADDFKVQTEEGQGIGRPELMLMYVAVTRAQTALDPGILAQVC